MIGKWLKKFVRKKNPEVPEFWKHYLRHFSTRSHPDTPIQDLSLVVLDTETTGTDPHTAELLSLGGVQIQKMRILAGEALELDFVPPRQINRQSITIHGIMPEWKGHQIEVSEGLYIALSFWGGSILIGHHIAFDLAIINKYLANMGAGPLPNDYVDTNTLAIRLLGPPATGRKAYGLDSLCEKFGVPMHDRHTAGGDAFLTSILFLKLIKALEKRGVQKRSQLLSKGVKRYAY